MKETLQIIFLSILAVLSILALPIFYLFGFRFHMKHRKENINGIIQTISQIEFWYT